MAKKESKVPRYPVDVRWSAEDDAFIAEVYDLPGCLADGKTEVQAISAAHEAARMWIEVAQSQGRMVPPPSTEEPASGKFNLRLPVSLHRELQEHARREGVSLNQLVLTRLLRSGNETVGPYHIHKTVEAALNEAQTTSNCYIAVDRAVVVRNGMKFLPSPWRYYTEDSRTGAVFFENPEHVRVGKAILDSQ